jgi:hypothetical protein
MGESKFFVESGGSPLQLIQGLSMLRKENCVSRIAVPTNICVLFFRGFKIGGINSAKIAQFRQYSL